jgi:acetoin utilization deacetylase AcuC-like enzyme
LAFAAKSIRVPGVPTIGLIWVKARRRRCASLGLVTSLPIAWISHPACHRHEMAAGHPESPQRLAAIEDRLRVAGIADFMSRYEAPLAPVEALARVHHRAHIDKVLHADVRSGPVAIDADTIQAEHTLQAALRAAGAGMLGVDLALAGKCGLAFCAVRPPGHHAERARAMGFCFFNNVAVAAAHALARGLDRVAILDFDLHYGNGTADIFMEDSRVLLCSTYQHPLYPYWTGAPHAANLIDAQLAAYSDGAALRHAVSERWLPAIEQHRPQLILVSAGFDAHAEDPLGDLRWSHDDYRWLGSVIGQLAESCCDGRVVATLEGGYHLDALARSVESFLRAFLGDGLPL